MYGGLDLANVNDLTALVLVSADGSVWPFCWLLEEGLVEKSRLDKVEYDVWKKQGVLLTTPGRAVNYDYITTFLRKIFDRCDVQAIAFDRVFMRFLRPRLTRAGFDDAELEKFVEHGQGFLGMAPAIRELEVRLLEKQLKHGNHPVLTMCAANAAVVTDDAGNRKFTKRKSTGRIDALVALPMAVAVLPAETSSSIYNERGIHWEANA